MKALIKSGNSQVWVEEGQEILLDSPKVDEVLAILDDGQISIRKATIQIKDLGIKKGPKVRTVKYKAKSRYTKTTGFRPVFHRVLIEKIDLREKKS
ncbi:MAG: hypothetical protein UU38_C0013G0005 [Candidatus Wolfebacteria bacterium GW2011_GWB1_41_12]|uniref:50S ribosomal protein L21 n=1 Tax=Candidatus Wolfebacteria bacterium GW2011_GWB1_41_12 TaxID=1619006 RepID=A0A0G0UHD4_9BACT|nr:MAG: hypothetical protein UU38_C0013G0005 [Candidatus Wolfebacteria bacterium GW2011_GWB1_41_12]